MHQAAARLAGVPVAPGYRRPQHIREASERALDVWDFLATAKEEQDNRRPSRNGIIGYGLASLDDVEGGMRAGDLALLAGRPRNGVAELVTTIVAGAVREAIPVLWVSPMHTAMECYERLASAVGQIPIRQMRVGHLAEDSWKRVIDVTKLLASGAVFIADAPVQTPAAVAEACRDINLPPGSLVVIEDLQQIAADIDGANLYETTAGVGRALKVLARELEVAVVATSGLNRVPEHRVDKRPRLDNLRGAGDLEEAADHVMLTHYDEAYDLETARAGELDIIIAKSPYIFSGGTIVTGALQSHYSRVVDML